MITLKIKIGEEKIKRIIKDFRSTANQPFCFMYNGNIAYFRLNSEVDLKKLIQNYGFKLCKLQKKEWFDDNESHWTSVGNEALFY